MAVELENGDIVYAKGVAKRGTTSSLEYTLRRGEHFVCLMLGTADIKALPKLPEVMRMALDIGIFSLDDIEEVLGREQADKFYDAMIKKYPGVTKP